jgi:iron(III) transport system ATP-binding protein
VARLTLERLGKSFGAFKALDDVSLAVADGEFVAILGAVGMRKTTLLRQVAGFDRPDAGRILIGDKVVSTPERQVSARGAANRDRLPVVCTVAAHDGRRERGVRPTVAGVRDPERTKRVNAALALVELEGFAERRPALLSGGQRQRVALARCLVTEPSLVLLDEPLANLDVHLRAAMEREFARFHERTGTTMIYITHDQKEAMALADRIASWTRAACCSSRHRRSLSRAADETWPVSSAKAWSSLPRSSRCTATRRATRTCSAIGSECVAALPSAPGRRWHVCAHPRCGS